MNIRKAITAIASTGVMLGLATAAFAGGGTTALPAGTPNPGFLPLAANLSGLTFLTTTGAQSFSTASWAGDVTENVYSGQGGHLTFTYQVTVNSTVNGDAVTRLTAGNYGGFTTLVGQSASGGTVLSDGATRSGAPGSTVGFNFFGGGVGAGQTSYLLYVTTNAAHYGVGTVGLIDSNVASLTSMYAPAVPEPASVAAFAITGMGIMFLMLGARRKRAFGQLA